MISFLSIYEFSIPSCFYFGTAPSIFVFVWGPTEEAAIFVFSCGSGVLFFDL